MPEGSDAPRPRGIPPDWRRIAGLETNDAGNFAIVWLAHDSEWTDVVHVYDVCLWRSEVLSIIADGIGARGRNIPVAWPRRSEAIAHQLLDRGIDVLHEPVADDNVSRELASREILDRIRSGRMRANARLEAFRKEYESYAVSKDGTPPRDTHPLMAATQHAVMQLAYAKAPLGARRSKARYPRLPII